MGRLFLLIDMLLAHLIVGSCAFHLVILKDCLTSSISADMGASCLSPAWSRCLSQAPTAYLLGGRPVSLIAAAIRKTGKTPTWQDRDASLLRILPRGVLAAEHAHGVRSGAHEGNAALLQGAEEVRVLAQEAVAWVACHTPVDTVLPAFEILCICISWK